LKYCIDTSALMDAWVRWYPIGYFPSLWDEIDALIDEKIIISSEEVLRELERKEDALHAWAKQRKDVFLPLSDEVQEAANGILTQFPTMVDDRSGKSFADPFVVATAKTTDTIVVTGEKGTGSVRRPKIPDVCESFDVPWLSIVGLIAEEGWSF